MLSYGNVEVIANSSRVACQKTAGLSLGHDPGYEISDDLQTAPGRHDPDYEISDDLQTAPGRHDPGYEISDDLQTAPGRHDPDYEISDALLTASGRLNHRQFKYHTYIGIV